jgi:anaerobic selenocysteine-containing dehydrogenase
MFDASDLPKGTSWQKFRTKGYYVVPAEKEALRQPTSYKWFADGEKKNVQEPHPLPGSYGEDFLDGLQTQSGKIEFIPETLKKFDDPERPALNKYMPSWEGSKTTGLLENFPLQLISSHARYSFHTLGDGKDSVINDIRDHRILLDGYYYWIARISTVDAEARGIRANDLVRLYNDRGSVICAAYVTQRLRPGVIQAYESSAKYDPIGEPGESTDRGGCVNQLTNQRSQSAKSSSMAPNACLIELELFDGEFPATEGAA